MKQTALVLATILVVLGAAAVAAFFLVGFYLSPQDKLAKADVVVAISGGETSARTREAVDLYNAGWAKHIIFSGAALDPSSPSNAATMARAAQAQGVPASAIILDETAANTRQNASGVSDIMRREGFASMILVTSPYHQRRAFIVFRRSVGADVIIINHSSFDQSWRRSKWWDTSYSQNLTLSELQKVVFELATGS